MDWFVIIVVWLRRGQGVLPLLFSGPEHIHVDVATSRRQTP
jgi:hypothetical protein